MSDSPGSGSPLVTSGAEATDSCAASLGAPSTVEVDRDGTSIEQRFAAANRLPAHTARPQVQFRQRRVESVAPAAQAEDPQQRARSHEPAGGLAHRARPADLGCEALAQELSVSHSCRPEVDHALSAIHVPGRRRFGVIRGSPVRTNRSYPAE